MHGGTKLITRLPQVPSRLCFPRSGRMHDTRSLLQLNEHGRRIMPELEKGGRGQAKVGIKYDSRGFEGQGPCLHRPKFLVYVDITSALPSTITTSLDFCLQSGISIPANDTSKTKQNGKHASISTTHTRDQ